MVVFLKPPLFGIQREAVSKEKHQKCGLFFHAQKET